MTALPPSAPPTADQLAPIRTLTEVTRAITCAATIDEVLRLAIEHAAALFTADQALLLVVNESGVLTVRASHGVAPEVAQALHESLSEGLSPRMALQFGVTPDRFLGVPLLMSGAIIGVLIVLRPEGAVAADHDEWLLSALADQAAVALEKARLGEIGEFRERLMAIVGHDLRTPLSSILMAADVLVEREGLGENERGLVRRIARSASLATRLIEQLLDLTRSRLGGGIPVDLGPVDLRLICEQVVGEVEVTHPDRPLRVQTGGDVVGMWDRDRLYQLLANLVGNAVHHGEPRTPIDLRIEGTTSEVVIEVANRGEPIPAAILPFIFEPFRKKRVTHPSRSTGLGLGLFICHQIVRSHSGTIAVATADDLTTFRVHLPRSALAAGGAVHG